MNAGVQRCAELGLMHHLAAVVAFEPRAVGGFPLCRGTLDVAFTALEPGHVWISRCLSKSEQKILSLLHLEVLHVQRFTGVGIGGPAFREHAGTEPRDRSRIEDGGCLRVQPQGTGRERVDFRRAVTGDHRGFRQSADQCGRAEDADGCFRA